MNKLIHISLLLTVAFALQSCISFNTTGLKYLSAEQKAMITKPIGDLDRLTAGDSIYTINDVMVKEWLADKPYAIVHSYLTWCKGAHCVNPAIVVKQLEETELPFLMIAGDFESKIGYHANYPFMVLDYDYYGTKNYSRCIEQMYRGLGCGNDWPELYFLFNRGRYVGCAESVAALMRLYETY